MTVKEEALSLCQKIGVQSMFDYQCNEGYSLPLHITKKIALVFCDKIIEEIKKLSEEDFYVLTGYWENVKDEIQKL